MLFTLIRIAPQAYTQKKTSPFSLPLPKFSVILERKAILLYIKAIRRIEKNRGYELETVLNSTNIKVVGNDEAITDETA